MPPRESHIARHHCLLLDPPVPTDRQDPVARPPNLTLFDDGVYPQLEDPPPPPVHTIHTSSRNTSDRLYRTNVAPTDIPTLCFPQLAPHTYRDHLIDQDSQGYRAGLELCQALDGRYSHKHADRYENCGTYAWFIRNEHTGQIKIKSPRCRLRMCPRCIGVDRTIKAAGLRPWALKQRYLKLITLTLQHHDDPPALMLKKLYKSFRKLKSRKFWKDRVTGSVWFLHAKFSWDSATWHLHLHVLVSGNFIPHGELKQIWHKITGDSTIVGIQAVKDVESSIQDVARYAAAPADQTQLDLEQRLDLHHALSKRRCCGASGTAKGILLRPALPDDGGDWRPIGKYEFVSQNKLTDPNCAAVWRAAWSGDPYDGPDLQPESVLYEDEASVLMDSRGPPESYKQFMIRLIRLRNDIHRGFDLSPEPAPF